MIRDAALASGTSIASSSAMDAAESTMMIGAPVSVGPDRSSAPNSGDAFAAVARSVLTTGPKTGPKAVPTTDSTTDSTNPTDTPDAADANPLAAAAAAAIAIAAAGLAAPATPGPPTAPPPGITASTVSITSGPRAAPTVSPSHDSADTNPGVAWSASGPAVAVPGETTAPSTTAPSTTAPSTTAPSTTAPSTTAPSNAPSTTPAVAPTSTLPTPEPATPEPATPGPATPDPATTTLGTATAPTIATPHASVLRRVAPSHHRDGAAVDEVVTPDTARRAAAETDDVAIGSTAAMATTEIVAGPVHGTADTVVPTTQVPLARTEAAAGQTAAATTPAPIPDADPNVARVGGVVRMIHRNGDTDGLSISLTPVELGRVKVELMTRDGQLSVHLIADHARGADALRTASGSLRSELEADGVRLDQLGVSLGDAGHGRRDGTPANAGDSMFDNPDTATPRRTGRSVPTDAPSTPRPAGRPRVLTADAVDLDL